MAGVLEKALNEAVAYHRDGELDKAISIYNNILARKPDNPTLLYLCGDAMTRKGDHGLAFQMLKRAVAIDPDHCEAWQDLGVIYKKEFFNDEAMRCWERALAIEERPEIYINMASLYSDYGRPEQGMEYSLKALRLLPDSPEAHWNYALALLSLGRWREGWKEYEYRRKLDQFHERNSLDVPQWDGSKGRRVAVTGEQGVGDEIMFASCIPDLIERSEYVCIECEPRLVPVFKRCFGTDAVKAEHEIASLPGGGIDCKIAFGSLPGFFRNRDQDFPGTSYLSPNPVLARKAKKILGKYGKGPWIGISWIGGTKPTRIHERSIPVTKMSRLRETGASLVSLQYGAFAEADARKIDIPHIPGWSDGTDIDKLIALVSCMDLVVTVTTTLVHVAGSIGKKTLVLAPRWPSWRYNGDSMPWYGNTELFRQTKGQAWDELIGLVVGRIIDGDLV